MLLARFKVAECRSVQDVGTVRTATARQPVLAHRIAADPARSFCLSAGFGTASVHACHGLGQRHAAVRTLPSSTRACSRKLLS